MSLTLRFRWRLERDGESPRSGEWNDKPRWGVGESGACILGVKPCPGEVISRVVGGGVAGVPSTTIAGIPRFLYKDAPL